MHDIIRSLVSVSDSRALGNAAYADVLHNPATTLCLLTTLTAASAKFAAAPNRIFLIPQTFFVGEESVATKYQWLHYHSMSRKWAVFSLMWDIYSSCEKLRDTFQHSKPYLRLVKAAMNESLHQCRNSWRHQSLFDSRVRLMLSGCSALENGRSDIKSSSLLRTVGSPIFNISSLPHYDLSSFCIVQRNWKQNTARLLETLTTHYHTAHSFIKYVARNSPATVSHLLSREERAIQILLIPSMPNTATIQSHRSD